MADDKVLANKRVTIWLASEASVTNLGFPLNTQVNTGMLNVSGAVRWDGTDFGIQESDQEDDRYLDDDASATTRGFSQFGGAVALGYPKPTDTTSIARQAYNLVKTQRTKLLAIVRIGPLNTAPLAVGDFINTYRVMVDGFNPDTEGTGSYAYVINLLPQGDVYPYVLPSVAAPTAVTVTGTGPTAVNGHALLRATYQGRDVTVGATWLTSSPTTVSVDNRGVVTGLAAGAYSITASFPGGTTSTPITGTIA